jgi:L-rhamnose isomerase
MKVAERNVQLAYELASKRYANIGVDTIAVLEQLDQIPISIQS